jgi:histidinol-phosphate/aromatic aminotransferase/cobyric acid decarboxylase-like protein
MKKIHILVLANHPEIVATIIRLINRNEAWSGVGAHSFEGALTAFQQNEFDLVLLGVGVDDEIERRMLNMCGDADREIICIRHFGGGSGLLYSEIRHALENN